MQLFFFNIQRKYLLITNYIFILLTATYINIKPKDTLPKFNFMLTCLALFIIKIPSFLL